MIQTILTISGAVFLTILLIIFLLWVTGRFKTSVGFAYIDDDVEQSIMSKTTVLDSYSPSEAAEGLIEFFKLITDKHPTHNNLIAIFEAEKAAKSLANLTSGEKRKYWSSVKEIISEKLQHPEDIHEYEGE
jgi:hypothetical protein